MNKPNRILLQTTIAPVEDDWNINRFSLLAEYLRSIVNDEGEPLYEITTRDRENDNNGNDRVLSRLDQSDFDELWLFAVDAGDGLSRADCEGVTRFRQKGGGLFITRDHQDLGSSVCTMGGVGLAHHFHSTNPDPDESRRTRDDQDTLSISWPNYHSGSNGDYQRITALGAPHELLLKSKSASDVIEYLPAHPHEGSVGVPEGERSAQVIATGISQVTQRPFNLIVAFESSTDRHGNVLGRGVADSSFHHLVDYNWDISKGCPSFLVEPPGNQIAQEPEKLRDVQAYVSNLARWLSVRE